MTPDDPVVPGPRTVRLAHLPDESAIRSVGQLCYLVGCLCLLGAFEFVMVAMGVLDQPIPFVETIPRDLIRLVFWAMAGLLVVVAAGHWALGYGLIRLQNWARWLVVALTVMSLVSWVGFAVGLCFVQPAWGLLGLAIGAGLHGLILVPLLRSRAGLIFSPGYRDVIRATPEIRARMHGLLKLALSSIGVGVLGLIAFLYYWINF